METVKQFIRIFIIVAVAILVLGVLRNATGAFTILNGTSNLLGTAFHQEIVGAGAVSQEKQPPSGWVT